MPKKTKKEKLLASYHRKIRSLDNKQIKINTPVSIPAVSNETKHPISEPITQELKNTNQYFFSDLKKSLLLIILIIGVEVGLYFAKLIK